jgi:hypothetical protein
MLNDRVAEHIPGCNMAFYKSVLNELGGFDPIFTKAGDDVDVCWRLQQLGHHIAFSHAGFVWHFRRATVRAYLRQQRGYGEAEALLKRKHPEYFNSLGGSIWHGRIYSSSKQGISLTKPIIYHGVFGSSFFQTIYSPEPTGLATFINSFEWHVGVTLPLLALANIYNPFWPLPLFALLTSMTVCALAAAQAELPFKHRRFSSGPLIAMLFFLQPIVRGYARHRGRFLRRATPSLELRELSSRAEELDLDESGHFSYWSQDGVDRVMVLKKLFDSLRREGWLSRCDSGWNEWDVEIFGDRWNKVLVQTVAEQHGGRKTVIRVRLLDKWTLFAKTMLLTILGLELVIINALAKQIGELRVAPILVSVVLFALFIHLRARRFQRIVAALVDRVAREMGLVRLEQKK